MPKHYDHVHKYERKKIGRLDIYKCVHPNCSHHITRELAENRISICWACGDAFIMGRSTIEMKRPRCLDCRKGAKKKEKLDRLTELLSSGNLLDKVKP